MIIPLTIYMFFWTSSALYLVNASIKIIWKNRLDPGSLSADDY